MPPEDDDPTADTTDDPGQDAGTVSMSQADLDRLIEARVRKAARAAQEQVAAELGVPLDQAKAMLEQKAAADDASKSETQRLIDEANQARLEAKNIAAAAAMDRKFARLTRALARDVADEQTLELLLAAPAFRALDADADDDEFAAAVDEVRSAYPMLFTGAPAAPGGAGHGARSSLAARRVPDQKPSTTSPLEQGAEAARARLAAVSGGWGQTPPAASLQGVAGEVSTLTGIRTL